jgi:type I restriction enzyme S subunit
MGSEVRPELPLGELVDVFDSLRVPVKSSDRKPGPYPYYGASGITDYVDSYIFEGEHLLLSEDGDNLRTRNTPIAFLADGKFWVNNHAHILRANTENNTKYLCYALQVADITSYLSGSTRPKLNQKDMRRIPVYAPPLPEQKAIAHILGTLDDKIELNRRMNATLEGMAQALFKSWFVDFDPVIDNALAAGNPIPDELAPRAEVRRQALANGTANREAAKPFPDLFQETEELGWIPEGWEAKPFGDLLENTIGGDWGKEAEDEKHTFRSVIIRGTDIPHILAGNRSSAPERWVEPKKFATRELQDSDIVIEISGGSPTQSTGRSLFITDNIIQRLGGSVEPASFCRRFRPLNKFYGLYGGLHLAAIYGEGKMWEYQNQSTGISNFQTTSFLEREFVAIPAGSELMEIFYDKARPFLDKMTSNQQEKLAKLRDTLLPKLISGELRIPEAEQLTKEALA